MMTEEEIYKQYYERLIELKGEDRANKFVEKAGHNLLAMQKEILFTSIYLLTKRYILRIWDYFYYPKYRFYYIVFLLLLILTMLFEIV